MKAWHFVSDTLRDGRPVPADGEVLVHEGPLKLCASGLHASKNILDALQYAPGSIICRVEVGGEIIHGDDKLVCSERTILWRASGEQVLRKFARMCALDVLHLWDAPDIVVQTSRLGLLLWMRFGMLLGLLLGMRLGLRLLLGMRLGMRLGLRLLLGMRLGLRLLLGLLLGMRLGLRLMLGMLLGMRLGLRLLLGMRLGMRLGLRLLLGMRLGLRLMLGMQLIPSNPDA
jgi:hypothetical protein